MRTAHSERGEDSSRTRAGRKIPSSDEVDRGRPRYRPGHRHYYPRYYRWGYGGWYSPYWGYYWGSPYYGGYYNYGYGYGDPYYRHRRYRTHPDSRSRGTGALDLDVSPERAEIYIDGEHVGQADDFDGFPGYLWLESGVYDVVIYSPGYETISRRMTIRPGEIIDVEDRLREGHSQAPEEFFADRRSEPYGEPQPWEQDGHGDVPEIERRDDGYGSYDDRSDGYREDDAYEEMPIPDDAARLHFRIEPREASVYLDGRFLGIAAELEQLSAGILVEPGDHELEVVHPRYRSVRREIDADEGDDVEIELELDRD